jgi:hypothetical protein
MEYGPLDPEGCGQGIEGFSGVSYAVVAAKRIKAAGGTLHLLAMDEPYYYAHFYDGPNACHWTPEKIAAEIDQFAKSMKTVFPEILIGDTEALAGPAGEQAYIDWMQTFREVNGYDMAFLHLILTGAVQTGHRKSNRSINPEKWRAYRLALFTRVTDSMKPMKSGYRPQVNV